MVCRMNTTYDENSKRLEKQVIDEAASIYFLLTGLHEMYEKNSILGYLILRRLLEDTEMNDTIENFEMRKTLTLLPKKNHRVN